MEEPTISNIIRKNTEKWITAELEEIMLKSLRKKNKKLMWRIADKKEIYLNAKTFELNC